jgi:hypothetical protein
LEIPPARAGSSKTPQWSRGHAREPSRPGVSKCHAAHGVEGPAMVPWTSAPSRETIAGMDEREISPMDFRAINRVVSRRAASKSPDAASMRLLRRALWFLWLTGARVDEMRWAYWDNYKPEARRLVVFIGRTERVLDLGPRAGRFLRWLHGRRNGRHICPAPNGSAWKMPQLRTVRRGGGARSPSAANPSGHPACPCRPVVTRNWHMKMDGSAPWQMHPPWVPRFV